MSSSLFIWLALGWVGLSIFVVGFVWRAGRSTGKAQGRTSAELEIARTTSRIRERQLNEAIDAPDDRDDLLRKLHEQGL